jgi:uncharacterized tellurite resistance protein B-like protein
VFDFFKRTAGRSAKSGPSRAGAQSTAAPLRKPNSPYWSPAEPARYSDPRSVPPTRFRTDWIPFGRMVEIAGHRIYGGIYVGDNLPGLTGRGPDPALIDPRLSAVSRSPDRAGAGLDYWPSYSHLSAASRAAYLEWLATERNYLRTPIGYVFLYFYGLERRIIVDCREPGPARAELPVIRAEIERLLSCYGGNASFNGYARHLLSALDFVSGLHVEDDAPAPVFSGDKWPTPFSLRIGLGEYSRSRRAIPAAWALAWAYFHPEIHLRTPATRCRSEFERLFLLRYTKRYGDGFPVTPNKTMVEIGYRAASSGLGGISLKTDVPDVFQLAVPARKLIALVEECTEALDPYSRWLGRFPDSEATPAAIALLPTEVVDVEGGALGGFLAWATGHLRTRDRAVVNGESLAEAWSAGTKTKLPRQECAALCRFLADHGIGIEPDPRAAGAGIGTGPRVLFGIDAAGDADQIVSGEYGSALVLLQLSAAVAVADTASGAEQEYLIEYLGSGLRLSPAELGRLRARLELLFADRVRLTGLTAKLAELTEQQRTQIAQFCLDVAAADGTVSARETAVLGRIYKMLGVPPPPVMTNGAPRPSGPAASGPVQVLPPQSGAARHTLPSAPAEPAPTPPPQTVPAPPAGLRLDTAAIAAKLAESNQVSAMLTAIFTDEAEQQEPPLPVPDDGSPPIDGLDKAHSALLRELAAETSWSRGAVEEICARHGLLPDGALDTLNDAALDRTGEPVVEGEDPMTINSDTLQEMLGD